MCHLWDSLAKSWDAHPLTPVLNGLLGVLQVRGTELASMTVSHLWIDQLTVLCCISSLEDAGYFGWQRAPVGQKMACCKDQLSSLFTNIQPVVSFSLIDLIFSSKEVYAWLKFKKPWLVFFFFVLLYQILTAIYTSFIKWIQMFSIYLYALKFLK